MQPGEWETSLYFLMAHILNVPIFRLLCPVFHRNMSGPDGPMDADVRSLLAHTLLMRNTTGLFCTVWFISISEGTLMCADDESSIFNLSRLWFALHLKWPLLFVGLLWEQIRLVVGFAQNFSETQTHCWRMWWNGLKAVVIVNLTVLLLWWSVLRILVGVSNNQLGRCSFTRTQLSLCSTNIHASACYALVFVHNIGFGEIGQTVLDCWN